MTPPSCVCIHKRKWDLSLPFLSMPAQLTTVPTLPHQTDEERLKDDKDLEMFNLKATRPTTIQEIADTELKGQQHIGKM